MALASRAKPGDTVLDLCAGNGGKSLGAFCFCPFFGCVLFCVCVRVCACEGGRTDGTGRGAAPHGSIDHNILNSTPTKSNHHPPKK